MRGKNTPSQFSTSQLSTPVEMEKSKTNCRKCELALNRKGENRPGIRCKNCRMEHCFKCADLSIDFCDMMKKTGKDMWTCEECESKNTDLKIVLESVKSIATELNTIKQGQAEQQAERAQVVEGLKTVEVVAKRLEKVEEVQDRHEEWLSKHDDALRKRAVKEEEDDRRIKKLEEQIGKMDQNAIGMRQCNAVVREVREIEKRVKNIILFNVPESKEKEEEDRRKVDGESVELVFRELGLEDIRPANMARIGKPGGRFPQQILVTLESEGECERVMKKWKEGVTLKDGVFITRDRTFNQRQEAKMTRLEREKEEHGGGEAEQGGETGGRGGRGGGGRGGGGRGRGRPRGRGGVSRGGRGGRGESGSRKRRNSGEGSKDHDKEDESKRQRTERGGGGGGGGVAGGGDASEQAGGTRTPEPAKVIKPSSDRPATPRHIPDSQLGAVGGVADRNF